MTDDSIWQFKFCVVLLMLDDLKIEGIIGGGFSVDRDKLIELVRKGQENNYPEPTTSEMESIVAFLNEAAAGQVSLEENL